ncbi:MAG: cytochrome c [Proteobacteria bacterium]|nr:MAG: cytochrome c [Pseudomonadota bacterium]
MKNFRYWLGLSSLLLVLSSTKLYAQTLPDTWNVGSWNGSWEQERSDRQKTLEAYLEGEGKKPFQWYRNVPLGHTGLPTVLYRLLPDLYQFNVAPENKALTQILDQYRKLWANPSAYGLQPFPTDFTSDGKKLKSSTRVAPLGLGFTQPTEAPIEFIPKVNIHLTFISCASCHTGRVVLEDNSIQYLYGAPTTEYDQTAFSNAQGATANLIPDDEETLNLLVKTIVKGMNSKPLGYFLGSPVQQLVNKDPFAQEVSDRLFWNLNGKKILTTIKSRVGLRGRIVSLLQNGKTGAYDRPNAPAFAKSSPGQLDAFGFGGAIIAILADDIFKSQKPLELTAAMGPDEAELAKRQQFKNLRDTYGEPSQWLDGKAAMVDPLSIWQENSNWRRSANWDGSQKTAGGRAISTSLAVTASPELVNIKGAEQMDKFMKGLTPPPYPFAIDKNKAARGQAVFEKNCATCHAPKVDRIFTASEMQVDQNRARQITEPVREGLLSLFWNTCKLTTFCGRKNQDPKAGLEDDDNILIPRNEQTMGYAAMPLDGIWARAPYLHNGSVPTLRALLTGERPTKFWRGNIRYNQLDVGFSTKDPKSEPYVSVSDSAAVYDTTLDGNSNQGHLAEYIDGYAINGSDANGNAIDWKQPEHKADLDALLEYLKSL